MRITSLGYNPANQITNYKNNQQNPAFNGKMEIFAENLAEVVGPKGLTDLLGFNALVADAQESLAAMTTRAVRPVFEATGQSKKAIMRVATHADVDAATLCRGYQTQCKKGVLKGVTFNFI